MRGQTVVRIWWDSKISAYRLMSSYNKELVELLNSKIPVSDREYDPKTKIWIFAERQLPLVRGLFTFLQITPKIVERSEAELHEQQAKQGSAASSSRSPIENSMCEFLRLMPYSAAQKAYREAQMTLHPDRGGSVEQSAKLNAAWDRIKKEVYNQ